jgi:hypothetical protein
MKTTYSDLSSEEKSKYRLALKEIQEMINQIQSSLPFSLPSFMSVEEIVELLRFRHEMQLYSVSKDKQKDSGD